MKSTNLCIRTKFNGKSNCCLLQHVLSNNIFYVFSVYVICFDQNYLRIDKIDLVSANSTTKSVENQGQGRAFVKYAAHLHFKNIKQLRNRNAADFDRRHLSGIHGCSTHCAKL